MFNIFVSITTIYLKIKYLYYIYTMNRNIKSEIIDDLEPAKEYVCKRIRWNNYYNLKKSNYRNRNMKEYDKSDLIQELSINYYKEHVARMMLLAKHNSVLKENEVLQQKIKELEKQQNIKSDN
jgi:hypothetical protein